LKPRTGPVASKKGTRSLGVGAGERAVSGVGVVAVRVSA
jgi:hypothetical protein